MKITKAKELGLPISRRGVLALALTYHKLPLFKLSLLAFLFFSPVLAYFAYHLIAEGAIMLQYQGEATAQWTELLSFRRWSYLAIIPTYLLAAVCLSGAIRVYRRFAFGEGYILKDDFLEGIKDNWKGNLLSGLFFGVLSYLSYFLISLFSSPEALFLHYGLLIVYFVLLMFFSVAFFLTVCLRDIYTNTFFGYIKGAASLFIAYLPSSALIYLMLVLPLALFIFLSGVIPTGFCLIAYFILVLLYAFFGYSLAYLSSFLLYARAADEAINKTQFPSEYRKGLYKGDNP